MTTWLNVAVFQSFATARGSIFPPAAPTPDRAFTRQNYSLTPHERLRTVTRPNQEQARLWRRKNII